MPQVIKGDNSVDDLTLLFCLFTSTLYLLTRLAYVSMLLVLYIYFIVACKSLIELMVFNYCIHIYADFNTIYFYWTVLVTFILFLYMTIKLCVLLIEYICSSILKKY
jgi:hypothetical protein